MLCTKAFDEVLTGVVADGEPGAAVAVIQNGEVIHRAGYGLADVEWNTPISADCSFRIASLTKQFTAAAILRLQDEGRLTLDDLLETHLADWDPRGRKVSLRHLLNHTSGIRNHDEGGGPAHRGRPSRGPRSCRRCARRRLSASQANATGTATQGTCCSVKSSRRWWRDLRDLPAA